MSNVDKIIEDLIKGASRAGAKVEFRNDEGHEVKLALDTSTLLGGVPLMGPGLAGLNAAANTGSMGSGALASMGGSLG